MKKKNILITILLTIVSLFMCVGDVWADEKKKIDDDTSGNTGTPSGGGGTSQQSLTCLEKIGVGPIEDFYEYPSYYGVRITMLKSDQSGAKSKDKDGNDIKTIDVLNSVPSNHYVTKGQCTKAEYSKSLGKCKLEFSTYASSSNNVISVGSIPGLTSFGNWTNSNNTIASWYKADSHANIDRIMDYLHYDYTSDKVDFDDFIVFEPLFAYGNKIGTAYEFLKSETLQSSWCNNFSTLKSGYYTECINNYTSECNCKKGRESWESLTETESTTTQTPYTCTEYCDGDDQTSVIKNILCNNKLYNVKVHNSSDCKYCNKTSERKECSDHSFSFTTSVPLKCEDPTSKCESKANDAANYTCGSGSYSGYGNILKRAATTVFTKKTYFGLVAQNLNYGSLTADNSVSLMKGQMAAGIGILTVYETFEESELKFDVNIMKYSSNDHGLDGAVSGAKFTLTGNGTTATCTSNTSGTCNLAGLTEGTYTLTETVPAGYSTADSKITCEGLKQSSGYCSGHPSGKSWTIKLNYDEGDYNEEQHRVTVHLKIYNTKTCKELFSQYSSTMAKRVELYTRLKNTVGQDYRALLNMSNTTADAACKSVTVSRSINSGCMSFKSTANTFNKDNLSNFTELYSIGNGKFAYCSTELNITNSFRKDGVYEYTTEYQFNTQDSPIKSGQQLFPVRDETGGNIAKGVLTKTCFIYSQAPDGMSSSEDSSAKTEYDKYISVVKIDNKELNETVSVSGGPSATNDGSTYTKTYTAIYSIKPVYSEYGTGKLTTEKSDNARLLGQSIYSKFDDKIYDRTWIPLQNSVTYTNKVIKSIGNTSKTTANLNSKCTYYVEQEIVDSCDPSKGMDCGGRNEDLLRIEYRTIDTKTPFPGESGTSARAVGANWCGTLARTGSNASINIPDCSNSNNIVEKYIKNSTNSYGRVESTSENKSPKYSFTLNATNIRQIRNYRWNNNKVYDYDDFASLNFDGSGKSSSSLLRSILGI